MGKEVKFELGESRKIDIIKAMTGNKNGKSKLLPH